MKSPTSNSIQVAGLEEDVVQAMRMRLRFPIQLGHP